MAESDDVLFACPCQVSFRGPAEAARRAFDTHGCPHHPGIGSSQDSKRGSDAWGAFMAVLLSATILIATWLITR